MWRVYPAGLGRPDGQGRRTSPRGASVGAGGRETPPTAYRPRLQFRRSRTDRRGWTASADGAPSRAGGRGPHVPDRDPLLDGLLVRPARPGLSVADGLVWCTSGGISAREDLDPWDSALPASPSARTCAPERPVSVGSSSPPLGPRGRGGGNHSGCMPDPETEDIDEARRPVVCGAEDEAVDLARWSFWSTRRSRGDGVAGLWTAVTTGSPCRPSGGSEPPISPSCIAPAMRAECGALGVGGGTPHPLPRHESSPRVLARTGSRPVRRKGHSKAH